MVAADRPRASRSSTSISAAARRPSWRRRPFAGLMAAMRHPSSMPPCGRDRGRDRPAHAVTDDMIDALGSQRRQPRQPGRAKLRSRRAERDQPHAELRADRRRRPTSCRAAGIDGINFDLIYGLPHQTVASCLDTVARRCSWRRTASRCSAMRMCPGLQEAPAHDRRGRAARRPCSGWPGRRHRACADGRRLCADRPRPFRAARRSRWRVAFDAGHPAAQLPGLHHRPVRRPARIRRVARSAPLPQGYVQNTTQVGEYAPSDRRRPSRHQRKGSR